MVRILERVAQTLASFADGMAALASQLGCSWSSALDRRIKNAVKASPGSDPVFGFQPKSTGVDGVTEAID